MNKNGAIKNKKSHKKQLILAVIVLLIALCVGAYTYHKDHHVTHIKLNNNKTATVNTNVPGGSNNSSASSSATSSKGESSSSEATSAPTSTIKPNSPSGEFVSDHNPNLGSSPAPNTETSTCITTPGVQCTITFTSGGTVKSLPSQMTDSNGDTQWTNWTLQSIGLTAGAWKVSAVATNGSNSATAEDATPLVINQ